MDGGGPFSGGSFKLYKELELQELQDKFVIKSVADPDRGFSIERLGGAIEPLNGDSSSSASPSKTSTIYGVAGKIRLLAGNYVLVITSRKEVGTYLSFPVYRVTSMRFLSCNEGTKNSTAQDKKDEAYFMALLKTVQSTPGLYFSYETDITLKLTLDLFGTEIFWTNLSYKLDGFIMVFLNLHLSFQTAQLKLKGSSATLTIVSRRCTRRLGTRMWRRGANLDGDVANFIETEQLVETEGFQSSLLQLGDEGQLSMAFSAEMQNLPSVRYVSFDFHRVCGNSNFENLRLLYEQISEQFEKQG